MKYLSGKKTIYIYVVRGCVIFKMAAKLCLKAAGVGVEAPAYEHHLFRFRLDLDFISEVSVCQSFEN